MIRKLLLASALALLTGCATGGARPDSAALASQLRAQADAWDAAIVRKDRAAIGANMAESFLQIGSDGAVADKAAFFSSTAITRPSWRSRRIWSRSSASASTATALLTGATTCTVVGRKTLKSTLPLHRTPTCARLTPWRVANVQNHRSRQVAQPPTRALLW